MPADPLRAFRLVPLAPPTAGRVALGLTRYGWWFAMALLVMLLASLNYNLNLGFGLVFLCVGLSLAACLQTRRNLRGIRLQALAAAGVFAGEAAVFPVRAQADTERLNIAAGFALDEALPAEDLSAHALALFSLALSAPRRGRLRPGPVVLQTVWPLGLFRAWTVVDLDLEALVWPTPAAEAPDPVYEDGREGQGQGGGPGVEDFRELRPYVPGDPPQRISWKASTRGQGLFVKEFEGMCGKTPVLDFARLPSGDVEARCSALCAMVLKAHGQGLGYALRLPEIRLDPGPDPHAHRRACLDALALYRAPVYGAGAEDPS